VTKPAPLSRAACGNRVGDGQDDEAVDKDRFDYLASNGNGYIDGKERDGGQIRVPVGDWDIDVRHQLLRHDAAGRREFPRFHRALVTIGFFGLDDIDLRSDLFLERAIVIVSMMRLLEDAHDPNATAAQRATAQRGIDRYQVGQEQPRQLCQLLRTSVHRGSETADACFKAADVLAPLMCARGH
jgi:hypothetical protein